MKNLMRVNLDGRHGEKIVKKMIENGCRDRSGDKSPFVAMSSDYPYDKHLMIDVSVFEDERLEQSRSMLFDPKKGPHYPLARLIHYFCHEEGRDNSIYVDFGDGKYYEKTINLKIPRDLKEGVSFLDIYLDNALSSDESMLSDLIGGE